MQSFAITLMQMSMMMTLRFEQCVSWQGQAAPGRVVIPPRATAHLSQPSTQTVPQWCFLGFPFCGSNWALSWNQPTLCGRNCRSIAGSLNWQAYWHNWVFSYQISVFAVMYSCPDSIAVSLFGWSKQIQYKLSANSMRQQDQNNYSDTETRCLV